MMQVMDLERTLWHLAQRLHQPPTQRLAGVVQDVLDGHLGWSVHAQAQALRQLADRGAAGLDQALSEFAQTSLNPLSAVYRTCRLLMLATGLAPACGLKCGQTDCHPLLDALHLRPFPQVGPRPAGDVVQCASASSQPGRCAALVAAHPAVPKAQQLSDVARHYHLEHTATFEVLGVLEDVGHVSVDELARALHTGTRTLQRHLRQEGTSPESLRCAVRLLRANQSLRQHDCLTQVALDAHYSDASHMCRDFHRACGLSPKLLRTVYQGRAPSLPN